MGRGQDRYAIARDGSAGAQLATVPRAELRAATCLGTQVSAGRLTAREGLATPKVARV